MTQLAGPKTQTVSAEAETLASPSTVPPFYQPRASSAPTPLEGRLCLSFAPKRKPLSLTLLPTCKQTKKGNRNNTTRNRDVFGYIAKRTKCNFVLHTERGLSNQKAKKKNKKV
ncbi:hypothetical protein ES332_A12G202400v1, partial [Gossypium tomentosum]